MLTAVVADPRIVALVCSWHPLTSADNAGEDGCQYGPGTTIVPVECAGTVTTSAILRALTRDAAGVLVAACGRGDCHYANGNESCEKVVDEARAIMKLSGIPPERLRLDLSSEVDGARFAKLIADFAAELSGLGGRSGAATARPKRRAAGSRAGARKAASGKARSKRRASGSKAGARKAASSKGGTKRRASGSAARTRKGTSSKSGTKHRGSPAVKRAKAKKRSRRRAAQAKGRSC